MAENKSVNLYPELVIKNNDNPNRLLAFPFLGILIKTILLIPVLIEAIFLAFGYLFFAICLPFAILFTGKYWDSAYNFLLGYFKFKTKVSLYYYGLTDKYPGFGLDDGGIFTLSVEKPQNPSRLLAFPLLGFLIRSILLIPFGLFAAVLSYGAMVAVFLSWFNVLFTGKYPLSLYEFIKDNIRVSLADEMYTSYLSDVYPSFYMSIKNKTVRNLLIIAGALFFLLRFANGIYSGFNDARHRNSDSYKNMRYDYRNK